MKSTDIQKFGIIFLTRWFILSNFHKNLLFIVKFNQKYRTPPVEKKPFVTTCIEARKVWVKCPAVQRKLSLHNRKGW